jgi:hypothetical protein
MKKSKFRSAFKVPRHSYDDFHRNEWAGARNTNKGERLSTVALLIKVLVFVKYMNNICNLKWSRSKLVSTKRSTVHSIPFQ